MDRDQVAVIAVVVCIVNGMFSDPLRMFFFATMPAWYPGVLPVSIELVGYFSSLLAATTTLVLSGVPAALYERFVRPAPDSTVPSWIWALAALGLSWESVDRLVGMLFTRGG